MSRVTLIVLATEAVLAVVGLVGGRWIGTPILADTRVDLRSVALALAATLPLVALTFWSVGLEYPFFARLREVFRKTLLPLFGGVSLIELLLISLLAGIGEEVFFRAFLQGSLARVVDPWLALVLISALFGLVHAVSIGYAIFAGLIGAYLGALLLVTGNLFVPMAVHALFDFVAILLVLRVVRPPASEPAPT